MRLVWAIALLAAVPLLVAAASLARDGWATTGEFAQAEMRVRDFWDHPPELGATGRLRDGEDVSSHPGPAAWWAMYPVYATFGRTAVALSTAVAVMAAVWMMAAIWIAARRGGMTAAIVVALSLVALARGLGPEPFVSPWNPWFGVMPFACFVLAIWASACQSRWAPAIAVGAGSFCVQAHVGYLPMVALLCLIPVVMICRGLTQPRERRHWLGALGAALGVGAVMWVLPVTEQVTGHPGNFTVLWRAYSNQDDPALGVGGAIRLVARHLDLFGPWVTRHDAIGISESGWRWGTLLLVVAWIVAIVVAWRRRAEPNWAPIFRLHAVLLFTVSVSVITVSRILGDTFGYLVVWLDVITALCVAAIAWTACQAVSDVLSSSRANTPADLEPIDADGVRKVAAVSGAVLLGVLVLVTSIEFADVEAPGGTLSDTTAALGGQAEQRLGPGQQFQVSWQDPAAFGGVGFGLMMDLERRGVDVVAEPRFETEVRPHRVRPPGEVDATIWVVSGVGIDAWRAAVPDTEIAAYDPRDATDRAEADALHQRIVDQLSGLGGDELATLLDQNLWAARSDPRVGDELRSEIDRYAAFGLPTAVFLLPPGAVPPV